MRTFLQRWLLVGLGLAMAVWLLEGALRLAAWVIPAHLKRATKRHRHGHLAHHQALEKERRARMRSWLPFVLSTVAVFAVATLAWPPVPHLRTSYLQAAHEPTSLGRPDAMLTSWMLAWASHALRTNPVDLRWSDPDLEHNVLLLVFFIALPVASFPIRHLPTLGGH